MISLPFFTGHPYCRRNRVVSKATEEHRGAYCKHPFLSFNSSIIYAYIIMINTRRYFRLSLLDSLIHRSNRPDFFNWGSEFIPGDHCRIKTIQTILDSITQFLRRSIHVLFLLMVNPGPAFNVSTDTPQNKEDRADSLFNLLNFQRSII